VRRRQVPNNLKYSLVVDDPERDERLEIDLDNAERSLNVFVALFSRGESNTWPSNHTQLRHMANRITNTKTGEVLKDRWEKTLNPNPGSGDLPGITP
jgi:hypothetical protein